MIYPNTPTYLQKRKESNIIYIYTYIYIYIYIYIYKVFKEVAR